MTESAVTSLNTLTDFKRNDERLTTFITDDWLQGRTAFGGLTAALCLAATMRLYPNLPPLRSGQISFIGPCAGEVRVTTTLLRQGRNVTFVRSDLVGEKGLATSCTFTFGTTRKSTYSMVDMPMPDVLSPEEGAPFQTTSMQPTFSMHYDQRFAGGSPPVSGADDPVLICWVRDQEWANNQGIVSLLSLSDALPPAIMSCFTEPGPISSMTWMINFHGEEPQTDEGWWLLRAKANHTEHGYSSQDMMAWNRRGDPMFTARQSVAIFV